MNATPELRRLVLTEKDITRDRLRRAVSVVESAFPRWPPFDLDVASVDHLAWKLEYPGWDPSRLSLGLIEGQEVYVCLHLNRVFYLGSERCRVRDWVDSAVLPQWQGTGVYSRLFKLWEDDPIDYDFGWWSSIEPRILSSSKRSQRDIDFEPRLATLLKPIASSAELAEMYLPTARWSAPRQVVGALISATRALARRRERAAPPNDSRLEVRTLTGADDVVSAFDRVAAKAPRLSGLWQQRDAEYVRWRYCDARAGRIRVLAVLEGGEPVGVMACRMSGGIGYVMEIIAAREGRDAVASELVAAAGSHFESEGAAAVICRVVRDSPIFRALRAHGYMGTPLRTGCYVMQGRKDRAELARRLDGGEHHIVAADFDWG